MKIYEIDGYLTGIKLRQKSWAKGNYIYFDKVYWVLYHGGSYDNWC